MKLKLLSLTEGSILCITGIDFCCAMMSKKMLETENEILIDNAHNVMISGITVNECPWCKRSIKVQFQSQSTLINERYFKFHCEIGKT